MTSLRGPNGLTTRWQYDRFGRKTREDRADGTWSTITRGFCQHGDCPADAPWNAALVTTTQSAGSTPVTTYADRLGRVIREQRVGFDGTPVYQDTEYNALGQVECVSLPYFAGETAYWTTNTYDLLGRVIRTDSQQSNGATRTSHISHRGRATVTTDPLGHRKTTIKNLQGKIARVEQEEHTWVNYTYDPTGNLTRTDSNGSITELSYDLRGRKSAMNDPNMGQWQYRYNVFGELTSQTDAKGQTVTMQYDPLGRMIKRTEPEGTTTWQYDTATNGIGKLHKVTGPDGYTKTHSYDSLGRPQGTGQQAAGTTLAHQLEYDQYSRINKETRPNGFILTKHYNAQGYLEAVQTPSNQIDDYDWTHLEQLLEDSLVNAEEALRRAGEYQEKADYYTKWAGIYQRIADYYAKSSTKYQALAQQVRGSVEELLKVADELQRQAERYERLAHSYMIAMRRFVHLSSLDVAADQSRSYTDTSADKSTWNNYFLGGGGTAKSLANGYAWCSNLVTCQFWGRVSQRIAEMYQRLAADKAAKANLYRTASEDEQLRLANELADQRLEKSAYYQRKSDDYRERVEQNLKKAQDAQQQADYWQGVAERALDESLSPHYQAMLADRDNITLWRAVSRDAAGRLTQHINGNGLSTRNHYDQATGQLHSIMTGFSLSGDVRHISYRYDQANNLLERTDERTGFHEQFSYDRLERLTHTNVYGRIGNIDYHYDVSQTYDAQGNITHKSDMGDYQYDPNRSQQLTSAGTKHIGYQYDANGNITQGGGRSFQWASYNKPTRLQKGDSIVSFNYGAEHNRYRKVARINGETITTDYFGKLYEKETSQQAVDHKHHIYADGQLVAIHIEHQQGGADETRYLHYDALGSVDTITDGQGKVIERMSYDPWGKRRGGDWRIDDPLNATQFHLALFTNRGFTGHEHIDELELIHMNGRVYDPEIGRFLSADPNIQAPQNSQSYNRYSYVLNNPLKYTDPSGYFFKKLFKGIKKVFKSKIFKIVAVAALAWFAGAAAFQSAFWKAAAVTSNMGAIYGAGITAGLTAGGAVIGAAYGYSVTGNLKGALLGGLSGASLGSMAGGLVTGALSGGAVGLMKSVGHQAMNYGSRSLVSRIAKKNGWSVVSVDLAMIAFSFAGNHIVGSRVQSSGTKTGLPEIHGIMSRRPSDSVLINSAKYPKLNLAMGLPFDAVDIALGYQGLPTASWLDAYNQGLFGRNIAGHSLGTLDASNLAGLGFVRSARLYSLPFGNTAPGNTRVSLGALDVVNGGVLGRVFNPFAETETKNGGVWKHFWHCYLADPC
ncbi:MAG: RHS repeat-associated core domain-containing protein [Sedimenticola sp.]